MLNATVGVSRVLGRLHRPSPPRLATATAVKARGRAAAGQIRHGASTVVAASRLVPARERTIVVDRTVPTTRRSILGRLGTDRAVAVAVAGILLGASLVSVTAGHPSTATGATGSATGGTGGTNGSGTAPRLAIGGGTAPEADDSEQTTGTGDTTETSDAAAARMAERTGTVQFGAPAPISATGLGFEAIDLGDGAIADTEPIDVEGPFIDDGTLVKPVAVDTTVPDGSDLVETYKVKAGDTLTGIATKFGVSMMTVWWANDLKSKDDLKAGQTLHDPAGHRPDRHGRRDRHARRARREVQGRQHGHPATNGLDDPNLVVGQVLVVPGRQGQGDRRRPSRRQARAHDVEPGEQRRWRHRPTSRATLHRRRASSGRSSVATTTSASTSTTATTRSTSRPTTARRVRAAAGGTVIFAGWKSNGGGYQVWIAHGSGLYTTYNHMSAISVGRGQHVGAASRSAGSASPATRPGPHLHFEVWRAPSGTAAAGQSARLPVARSPRPRPDPLRRGRRAGRARMAPMFLDRVKIWVRAGDGGDGAATFRQEAHVPRGGPDGGDGGRGGSVHLRVDAGQTTLRDFNHRHHFQATPGGRGTRARRHGKAGDDLTLDVPPGTAVYDDETGELLADLVAVGQSAMVARGGRGGLGNTHFKTSTHQAPKHAQKGEPGAEAGSASSCG